MRKTLPSILLSFLSVLPLQSSAVAGQLVVTEVYDGNTVLVEANGARVRIRMAGIDAPEMCEGKWERPQPYSRRAFERLSACTLNKRVTVKWYGGDTQNGFLGVIYADGKNVNLLMVREGLAEVDPGSAKKLDLAPFLKAQRQAKKEKIGIWSLGDRRMSPCAWRRKERCRLAMTMLLYCICNHREK